MSRKKVALVTGASKGLGAAIAQRLGADGFSVAVNYLSDEAGAQRVVASVKNDGNGNAVAFQSDVTDEQSVMKLASSVREALGEVEVLVLNATGPQPLHTVEQLSWPIMLDQLKFFVKSPVLLLNEFLPNMKKNQFGRIIFIGSEVVDTVPRAMSAYTSAKSAQLGLARTWAKELAPYNVIVNTVAPGWIPVERHADCTSAEFDSYIATVPIGFMGDPCDVAGAVSFLASQDAKFVAGIKLSVNGGSTVD